HHVLEDRAEPPGSRPDLRLRLGREPDDLGIAAAFEVEDALVRPAVLVIADKAARGIGGEGCLSRAGEAEEYGRIALWADIGRAVHGQNPLLRQQVVHDREN